MTLPLPRGCRIVFFGDSVTDCDRDRGAHGDEGLGLGYVRLCHALLHARFPERNLTVLNRESAATGFMIWKSVWNGMSLPRIRARFHPDWDQ